MHGTREASACTLGGIQLNSTVNTALLWVVIIVLVFLLWSLFQTTKATSEQLAFSTFLDRVNQGYVESVVIRGDDVRGETKPTAPGGKKEFHTIGPTNYPPMLDLLRQKGVSIEYEPSRDQPFLTAPAFALELDAEQRIVRQRAGEDALGSKPPCRAARPMAACGDGRPPASAPL